VTSTVVASAISITVVATALVGFALASRIPSDGTSFADARPPVSSGD
jgi:hypothetical protein